MASTSPNTPLLLNFAQKEAVHGVTRKTVKDLRVALGLTNETAVVQYALAVLRDSLLPRYEADDGAVPDAVLKRVRAAVNQDTAGGKSLFDET
ncbi:MAG: hypothetical protein ACT4PZ_18585 [Panacagrimonas sp.]